MYLYVVLGWLLCRPGEVLAVLVRRAAEEKAGGGGGGHADQWAAEGGLEQTRGAESSAAGGQEPTDEGSDWDAASADPTKTWEHFHQMGRRFPTEQCPQWGVDTDDIEPCRCMYSMDLWVCQKGKWSPLWFFQAAVNSAFKTYVSVDAQKLKSEQSECSSVTIHE